MGSHVLGSLWKSRARRLLFAFWFPPFMSLSPARCSLLICLLTGGLWSFAEPASRSCVNHSFPTLLGFWFSKFGGPCPSGSRKIQHFASPSATGMLSMSSPSSTNFLPGEGHCEAHHKACNHDFVGAEIISVSTFAATPSTFRDAGQKLSCVIDRNACFFTGLRGFVVTSTSRGVGSHRPYRHASSVETKSGQFSCSMALISVITRLGGLRLVQNKALMQFEQVLSTQQLFVCAQVTLCRDFLWSPSWHRNLRVARALARVRHLLCA